MMVHMSDSRAGSYRVRIAGQEIVLPDLDAVRRLSEGGQLGSAAEVRAPGSEQWVPLASVLNAPKQNPWDVWEQADEVDPKEIWKEYSTGSHPAVPHRPDEAEDLPSSALAPVEDDKNRGPRMVINGGKRPASGKVINFPTRASAPKVEGSQALAPEPLDSIESLEPLEPVPLRPPPRPIKVPTLKAPEEPPPATRWPLLIGVTLMGVLALVGIRWWVVGQATERFPTLEAAPVASEPAAAPSTTPPEATPPTATTPSTGPAPYGELEATLRERLPQDIRDVTDGVTLEDALTVELHAMRTNVMRVEAPVSGWVGRGADRKPKVIELGVYLRSDADRFDQDLAAVGLVVGKYVLRYGYEVQRLEVVFEGLSQGESRIKVNPESARLFYLGRKDLLQFLQTR